MVEYGVGLMLERNRIILLRDDLFGGYRVKIF